MYPENPQVYLFYDYFLLHPKMSTRHYWFSFHASFQSVGSSGGKSRAWTEMPMPTLRQTAQVLQDSVSSSVRWEHEPRGSYLPQGLAGRQDWPSSEQPSRGPLWRFHQLPPGADRPLLPSRDNPRQRVRGGGGGLAATQT